MMMKDLKVGQVAILTDKRAKGEIVIICSSFNRFPPYCQIIGKNRSGWDNWAELDLEVVEITNTIIEGVNNATK